MMAPNQAPERRLIDRAEIQDALGRYARGVDTRDWPLVRTAYHDDAHDDHGAFSGDVDGLIAWLAARFAEVEHATHFLGSSQVEFAGTDAADVETRFISTRLEPTAGAGEAGRRAPRCRQSWGRYLDRFERRGGAWRIARRRVVVDMVYRFTVDPEAP